MTRQQVFDPEPVEGNMNKLRNIIAILIFLQTTTMSFAYAADDLGANKTITQGERIEARATNAAGRQDTNLAKLQEKAAHMIDERIANLNNLITRITNDKRLSPTDKTNFITDIQTTITSLTNLKAKILADTDITTARADAKSIVTSYHIYLIFEPKERLSVIIDNLLTVTTNVQGLMTQVQGMLTTLQSQGKDITALQALVTDINSKLSDASTKLNADKTTLGGISVTQDPATAKTVFTQVRTDLASVRQDFAAIRADFAKLRAGIKSLFGLTPTPSAIPTK